MIELLLLIATVPAYLEHDRSLSPPIHSPGHTTACRSEAQPRQW